MSKRNLFGEMMRGVCEMAEHRTGSGRMRADFEAYMTGPQFGMAPSEIERNPETGEYQRHDVQTFWLVWIASRASIDFEMPAIEAWDSDGRLDRERDDEAGECVGLVPAVEVRSSLREAGVTVK